MSYLGAYLGLVVIEVTSSIVVAQLSPFEYPPAESDPADPPDHVELAIGRLVLQLRGEASAESSSSSSLSASSGGLDLPLDGPLA